MKNETFKCCACGQNKPVQHDGGTGYGTDKAGNKICYECIGLEELFALRAAKPGETFIMYFDGKQVMNWPGSFKQTVTRVHAGRHNIAGKRYDFYFFVNRKPFHGVTYGDNTQIAHVKRIKA
jgi:hypothetical protein